MEASTERERATDWPIPHQEVLGTRDGFMARVEDLVAHAALSLPARLPVAAQRRLVSAVARLARLVDRRRSDAARRFLRQALGDISDDELQARVLQAWRHFLGVTLETEGFARNVRPDDVLAHYDIEMCADAEAVARSGRGSVVVTGHVGNWEAAAMLAPHLGFAPFYGIAKPPRNRPLSARLQRSREAWGIRLLPRRGAMKDAPKILQAGGTIGMLLDQRARKKPVLAPFFGRPARCDRSAGVLIKRLRVPVVLAACYQTDRPWRWRAVLPRVLDPDEFRGVDPEAIATRINAELEALILAAPEQYFWLHDRYKDTPEAFPEPDFAQSDSPASGETP